MTLMASVAVNAVLLLASQASEQVARPQPADTVVAILPPPTALQVATEVGQLVVSGLLVALFIAGLYMSVSLIRLLRDSLNTVQAYRHDVAPILDRGRAVAENVEFMSNVARRDFERLRENLDGLAERLGEASRDMEDRVHEFNALLEVVQGEAEDLFLDAAATVKGVQTGARELGPGGKGRRGEADDAGLASEAPDPSPPV